MGELRGYWINSLPPQFSSVKEDYKKGTLQDPWRSAQHVHEFMLATQHEIIACNIKLQSNKKPTPPVNTDYKTDNPQPKEKGRLGEDVRYKFPDPFNTSKLFAAHIRGLKEKGMSKEQIIEKYKD